MFQILINPSPFEYASQHLQLVGWPVLCWLAWQVSKYVDRAAHQFTKATTQIDTMSSNHFPHMEASLAKQDNLMESMDESLKIIALNTNRRNELT